MLECRVGMLETWRPSFGRLLLLAMLKFAAAEWLLWGAEAELRLLQLPRAAFDGDLNGSTQHPRETAPPGFRALESRRAVRKAIATLVSSGRAIALKSGLKPENGVCTGDGAVIRLRVPVFTAIGARHPVESLAIPLNQKHFRYGNGFPTKCCIDRLRLQPETSH